MANTEQLGKLFSGCTVAGPADNEMIFSAEAKLGVRFPESYRVFLLEFGAALCSGFEIAGLFRHAHSDEAPLWSDVVAKTNQLRRAGGGLIPKEFVAISDDGTDFSYYLDTRCMDEALECPVMVLGPGADGPVVAQNFVDFVMRACNNRLSF
jgi:antitoxin YobK